MTLNELLKDENFLRLLNEENSKEMAEFLDAAYLDLSVWCALAKMFKDLGIFQDIAIHNADPKKKYKYIIRDAFNDKTRGTLDLRGATVYYSGIYNPVDCEVIIDETTTIKSLGISIAPDFKNQNFKLTFLGIPKIERHGIHIYPKLLDQIEINVKTGLVDDVKQLLERDYILTDKKALRNRIKEI